MNDGRETAWGLLIILLITPICLIGGVTFMLMGAWYMVAFFVGTWSWAVGGFIRDFMREENDDAM